MFPLRPSLSFGSPAGGLPWMMNSSALRDASSFGFSTGMSNTTSSGAGFEKLLKSAKGTAFVHWSIATPGFRPATSSPLDAQM